MKNHRVRTSDVRAKETALVTEAFVRFRFTGICAMVPDNGHTPMLAVIPDGRRLRASATDPTMEVPSHHAFVMFPAAAASGRESDFLLKNGELGVCLLEHELITLAGGTIEALPARPSVAELVSMERVCGHGKAEKSTVSFPPREGVLAQVCMPSNALWGESETTDSYTYEPHCELVTDPQSGTYADIGAIDLRITDASTLMLVSHAFGGGPSREPITLSLDGTTAENPLIVTIGNVPLADLRRYVDQSPGGHEHARDVHFELYYLLAKTPPLMPVIAVEQMTKVPHASNCPIVIMDVEG